MRAIAAGVIVALVATGAAWGDALRARKVSRRGQGRRVGILALMALAWALGTGTAWGKLSGAQAQEAQGLIKELGAEDFGARETATRRLSEMGLDVLSMVLKTRGETADLEVKTRCEKVIAGIRLVEKRVMLLGKPPKDAQHVVVNWDGTRMCYEVEHEGKHEVWCDGILNGAYDGLMGWQWEWGMGFSGYGKHFEYAAREGKKWFIVKDGNRGPEWDAVDCPTMPPDGRRQAYWAKSGGKWFVVLDGIPGPTYEGDFQRFGDFSRDGEKYAYCARRGGKGFVVVDGVEGPAYEGTLAAAFSPDGKRVVYGAKSADGWHLVEDGKEEGAGQERFAGPTFSPDSKHLAYKAGAGAEAWIVADGKEGPRYDDVEWPVYSPGSESLAYYARTREGEMLILNGKKGPLFALVRMPRFSPDGKLLAYAAGAPTPYDKQENFAVCNGMRGRGYAKEIYPRLEFSEDNRHLAYMVESRDGQDFVAVDGIESPRHERVLLPTACSASGTLRYVAVDKEEAWLVEVEWPEGIDWTNGMKPIENQ